MATGRTLLPGSVRAQLTSEDRFTEGGPRACVIGAGSAGIAVAKALHDRGIVFDCYDLSDRVGGNWVYRNSNGISASYRSLHINTSRERMEFSDFPMPGRYPDFPRHDHIAEYFDAYVDHFGFRDRIRFQTKVEHVEPRPDGGFDVTIRDHGIERYDAVVVANGHHWDPRWPEPAFPGAEDFEGEQMHSHSYEHEFQLAGRDVVVLGMGNSAMDIAVDASYHSEHTILAARRGAHIVPKYVFGRPLDRRGPFDRVGPLDRLPPRVRVPILGVVARSQVGKMTDYGLPEPDHKFGHAHPTVSGRILDRLAHGAITVKPNIERLEGETVHFVDGTKAHADLVVYCTGYKISFPFLDADVISVKDNELRLYQRMFHPVIPNLYFPGLVQPLGAIMPVAECQGNLIGEALLGHHALPPRAEMERDIDRKQAAMKKRYVASKRHTIQVDQEDYMRDLAEETEAGRRRVGIPV
jgi:dimethylaniline monooxygenase (N-oxide forming)